MVFASTAVLVDEFAPPLYFMTKLWLMLESAMPGHVLTLDLASACIIHTAFCMWLTSLSTPRWSRLFDNLTMLSNCNASYEALQSEVVIAPTYL
jgi:glucan phosphoethanolaminetransferase (alkaline phosphatase superfamily)